MTSLITELFSAFTSTITGLAGGIKDAFMNILYVDPSASTLVISDLAKFGFIMLGFSLAIGLVYGAIRLIRNH